MNDDMIRKLVEVEMANAGIEDDALVKGKMLKALIVEVIKHMKPEQKA